MADHPTEQVDRVAAAMARANYAHVQSYDVWDEFTEAYREKYRVLARAALDAATPMPERNIVQLLPPEWSEPGAALAHTLDESCPCRPVLEAVRLSGGGTGYTLTHHPVGSVGERDQ